MKESEEWRRRSGRGREEKESKGGLEEGRVRKGGGKESMEESCLIYHVRI